MQYLAEPNVKSPWWVGGLDTKWDKPPAWWQSLPGWLQSELIEGGAAPITWASNVAYVNTQWSAAWTGINDVMNDMPLDPAAMLDEYTVLAEEAQNYYYTPYAKHAPTHRRKPAHGGGGGGWAFQSGWTRPAYAAPYPLSRGVWGYRSTARYEADTLLLEDLHAADQAARDTYQDDRTTYGTFHGSTYEGQSVADELGLPTALGGLLGGYIPGYADTPSAAVGASLYRSMNFLSALVGAGSGGLMPSFLAGAAEWGYRGGMLGVNPSDMFQFGSRESYYVGRAAQDAAYGSPYWADYYGAQAAAYGAMGRLAPWEVAWYGTQASSYLWGNAELGADVRLYGWMFSDLAMQFAVGAATAPYIHAMYQANPAQTEQLFTGQSYLSMAYGYQSPTQSLMQNVGLWGFGYGGIQASISDVGWRGFAESVASITAILAGASTLIQTGGAAWNRYQAGLPIVPPGQEGQYFWEDIGMGAALTAAGAYAAARTGQDLFGLGSAGQLGITGAEGARALSGGLAGVAALTAMEYARPYAVQQLTQLYGGVGVNYPQAQGLYTLAEVGGVMASQYLGARYLGPALADAGSAVAARLPFNVPTMPEPGEGLILLQSPSQYAANPAWAGTTGGFVGFMLSGIPDFGSQLESDWTRYVWTPLTNAYGWLGQQLPWLSSFATFPDTRTPAPSPQVFSRGAPTQLQIDAENAAFLASPYGQYRAALMANYSAYELERATAQAFTGAFGMLAVPVQQLLLNAGFSNPTFTAQALQAQAAWDPYYPGESRPTLADFMVGVIGANVAGGGVLNTAGVQAFTDWALSVSVPVYGVWASTTPTPYGPTWNQAGIDPTMGRSVSGVGVPHPTLSYETGFQVAAHYYDAMQAATGVSVSSLFAHYEQGTFTGAPLQGGDVVGYDTATGRAVYAYEAYGYAGGMPSTNYGISNWSTVHWYQQPAAAPTNLPAGFQMLQSGIITYGGDPLTVGGRLLMVPSFSSLTAGGQLAAPQSPYGVNVMGWASRGPDTPVYGVSIPGETPSGQRITYSGMAMSVALTQGGSESYVEGVDPFLQRYGGFTGPWTHGGVPYASIVGNTFQLTMRGGVYGYAPTGPLTQTDINTLHFYGIVAATAGTLPGGYYTSGTFWPLETPTGPVTGYGSFGFPGMDIPGPSHVGQTIIGGVWTGGLGPDYQISIPGTTTWHPESWSIEGLTLVDAMNPRSPYHQKWLQMTNPPGGVQTLHQGYTGPHEPPRSSSALSQLLSRTFLVEQAAGALNEGDVRGIIAQELTRAKTVGLLMSGDPQEWSIIHTKKATKALYPAISVETYDRGSMQG